MYKNNSAHLHIRQFNFNKSCIWIEIDAIKAREKAEFNFNKSCIWILYIAGTFTAGNYLTLTRVVFEYE